MISTEFFVWNTPYVSIYVYIESNHNQQYKYNTHLGAGSPSASHSMMNGLSFSLACSATWNSCSSVGGCLMICGGEWTVAQRNGSHVIEDWDREWARFVENGRCVAADFCIIRCARVIGQTKRAHRWEFLEWVSSDNDDGNAVERVLSKLSSHASVGRCLGPEEPHAINAIKRRARFISIMHDYDRTSRARAQAIIIIPLNFALGWRWCALCRTHTRVTFIPGRILVELWWYVCRQKLCLN